MSRFGLAVCIAALPGMALAEGFYTWNLGDAGDTDACQFRGQRSLNVMLMEPFNAGATMASGEWTVDGYNLQPGGVDVQILCAATGPETTVAYLVTHSDGDEADRVQVGNEIYARWNAPGQAGDVRDEGVVGK